MNEFKNGDKVSVSPGDIVFRFIGLDPDNHKYAWIVGKELTDKPKMFPLHLIYPYREPVKVSGWVNVYNELVGGTACSFHVARKAADSAAYADRVACVYVSGTEGEET